MWSLASVTRAKGKRDFKQTKRKEEIELSYTNNDSIDSINSIL